MKNRIFCTNAGFYYFSRVLSIKKLKYNLKVYFIGIKVINIMKVNYYIGVILCQLKMR